MCDNGADNDRPARLQEFCGGSGELLRRRRRRRRRSKVIFSSTLDGGSRRRTSLSLDKMMIIICFRGEMRECHEMRRGTILSRIRSEMVKMDDDFGGLFEEKCESVEI